jgi:para-aminobenzoate synthetase
MFFWDSGNYQLIGNSPELQLRIQDENIMIRPIAGTSKGKGHDAESRKKVLDAFSKDSKENAEHVMLVDLARNDIGIMAEAGSVKVTQLMAVEEFSHVFHLTSTVVGKLKKNMDTMEVFEATFPAGTLTGAPKVRAMEIISELEGIKRGPYGGAFGFFDFNGNIISSIVIRTIVRKGDELYLQASAGIVSDSVPEEEWEETEYKMKALKEVIYNFK